MGGLGSHLRTSAVTGALRRLNPKVRLVWFTHRRGSELLRYVPGVVAVDVESEPVDSGLVRSLDVLLNFEISSAAARLCGSSRCVGGFALNQHGRFAPASTHANRLQRLQIDDAYRRRFVGAMQQVLLEAVGLDVPAGYDLALPHDIRAAGSDALAMLFSARLPSPLIGLNIGSSRRGRLKRWPAPYWVTLAGLLTAGDRARGVVILSGPEDRDIRDQVASRLDKNCRQLRVVDGLSVGHFLAVVSELRVLVTADTFALHAARAQNVPVVALAGPMPHRELELGPADRIIGPELACGPCYYRCSQPVAGACMRRITPRAVATQVEEILGGGQPLAPARCRARPTYYRGGGGAPRSASRLP